MNMCFICTGIPPSEADPRCTKMETHVRNATYVQGGKGGEERERGERGRGKVGGCREDGTLLERDYTLYYWLDTYLLS